MIKIFKCNNNYTNKLIRFLEIRRDQKNNDVKTVSSIIKDVKKNKIKALLKYEKRFSKNKNIKPSKKKIDQSINQLDPKVKKAIDFAYNRILKFHSKQLKSLENVIYKDKFLNKLEYRSVPIESVAIYVPGNLPSTLLMNSVPAKLAKVKRLVLATPKINGKLNPAVLYAAKKVGITEIWNFGGAQAIASLAYIQKVNKVVGPGNRFVAEAKRQLSGRVIGTEAMFAGPSEICVLADKYSDVDQVATSLISQAEHDEDSQCIMVTKDIKLVNKVKKKIVELLKNLPRKEIAYKSLKNHGLIIKAKNDKQIINVINTISPEHLELLVKNYNRYSKKIINVGSICNGKYSPMCASDFTVGINHVLPTLGSARFSSGLNINEFIKKISVVTLSKLGVEKIANQAITLSEFEELFGHAQSIKSRIRRK